MVMVSGNGNGNDNDNGSSSVVPRPVPDARTCYVNHVIRARDLKTYNR